MEKLIAAFRRRRSEDLLIAGDGRLARRLRRMATDLPHVRFTGWLPQERLDELYRGARPVVVPTRGHEAFGLVAAEAFARGTPVIAHRFGALGELVDDTGAAIGYSSDAELDAALELIASDAGRRDELRQRARAACCALLGRRPPRALPVADRGAGARAGGSGAGGGCRGCGGSRATDWRADRVGALFDRPDPHLPRRRTGTRAALSRANALQETPRPDRGLGHVRDLARSARRGGPRRWKRADRRDHLRRRLRERRGRSGATPARARHARDDLRCRGPSGGRQRLADPTDACAAPPPRRRRDSGRARARGIRDRVARHPACPARRGGSGRCRARGGRIEAAVGGRRRRAGALVRLPLRLAPGRRRRRSTWNAPTWAPATASRGGWGRAPTASRCRGWTPTTSAAAVVPGACWRAAARTSPRADSARAPAVWCGPTTPAGGRPPEWRRERKPSGRLLRPGQDPHGGGQRPAFRPRRLPRRNREPAPARARTSGRTCASGWRARRTRRRTPSASG